MTTVTRVKICGLTSAADTLIALEAGADYVGFIFSEKSSRHMTIEQAAAVCAALPADAPTVGVFVDAPLETIYEARQRCGLKLIQLHGTESPLMLQAVGAAYKALRPASLAECEAQAAIYARGPADDAAGLIAPTLLLDAYHPALHGGTGLTVDPGLALAAKARTARLMLAGGLTADNVQAAIRAVQPFAVDVSSGVEAAPGRKDYGKLRAFIQAVKATR